MRKLIAYMFPLAFLFSLLVPFTEANATIKILDDATRRTGEVAKTVKFEAKDSDDVEKIIRSFLNDTLAILGVIAVLLVIYAGILWVTAAGSDEKIKNAKMIIRSVIIGILIAGFAYAITTFVIDAII